MRQLIFIVAQCVDPRSGTGPGTAYPIARGESRTSRTEIP